MKRLITALLALLLHTHTQAAEVSPHLPPSDLVARSLRSAPTVQAADSDLVAEEAQRRRLEAGQYEWTTRIGSLQRRIRPVIGGEQRMQEWSAALERPIRLPGKASLDSEIGVQGVALAQTARGDVLHESSRQLLKSWFTWLRESQTARQWAEQTALLEKQQQGILRRQELGDAARLESVQGAGALAQAQAQAGQARVRQQIAAEEIRRRYPLLPLLEPAELSEPPALSGDLSSWTQAILEHSHELAIARGELQRARLVASRQQAERLPDPTFGLQTSRERGGEGEERTFGAYLSIPLPGEGRRAQSDVSQAQAAAAERRAAATEIRIYNEAASLYHSASAARAVWQASDLAAGQLEEVARMTARAYQLGEGSLTDLLAARRLANESRLTARLQQLEALELHDRLRLDAHQLWDIDD